MCSLIASTLGCDSDGDEATEHYDDEKTETDTSASSSGSFDESGATNSEKVEVGPPIPPSPTHSAASDKTIQYDVSEDEQAETGETVMAFVPCKLYRGHFHLVPTRFFPNPTPQKRKVRHYIEMICQKQLLSLSEQDSRTTHRSKSV